MNNKFLISFFLFLIYSSNVFGSNLCTDKFGTVLTTVGEFIAVKGLSVPAAVDRLRDCSSRIAIAVPNSKMTNKLNKQICYDCINKNKSFLTSSLSLRQSCSSSCGNNPTNVRRAIKNELAIFGNQALSFDAESCHSENYASTACPNSSLNYIEGGCNDDVIPENVICGANEVANASGGCDCPSGKVAINYFGPNECCRSEQSIVVWSSGVQFCESCSYGWAVNNETNSCEELMCNQNEVVRTNDTGDSFCELCPLGYRASGDQNCCSSEEIISNGVCTLCSDGYQANIQTNSCDFVGY